MSIDAVALRKEIEEAEPPPIASAEDRKHFEEFKQQLLEAVSAENLYHTSAKIGDPQNLLQAFIHYTSDGGADHFRKRQTK